LPNCGDRKNWRMDFCYTQTRLNSLYFEIEAEQKKTYRVNYIKLQFWPQREESSSNYKFQMIPVVKEVRNNCSVFWKLYVRHKVCEDAEILIITSGALHMYTYWRMKLKGLHIENYLSINILFSTEFPNILSSEYKSTHTYTRIFLLKLLHCNCQYWLIVNQFCVTPFWYS
jgi:hypothetical protein